MEKNGLNKICEILGIPTTVMYKTDEVDENKSPIYESRDRTKKDLLNHAINELLKILNQETIWEGDE